MTLSCSLTASARLPYSDLQLNAIQRAREHLADVARDLRVAGLNCTVQGSFPVAGFTNESVTL